MTLGLGSTTHQQATVKMFPSYVRHVPDGTETGQVLALDLGGTNFRVLSIKLHGSSKIELNSKIFVVPQSVMIGDGKNVATKCFDYRKYVLFFRLFSYFDIWHNVCQIL